MSLLENAFKGGNLVTGLAVGIGALIAIPMATSLLRPLAKTAIKGGMIAYDTAAHLVTEASRATSETINEAQSEMRRQSSSPSTGVRTLDSPLSTAS